MVTKRFSQFSFSDPYVEETRLTQQKYSELSNLSVWNQIMFADKENLLTKELKYFSNADTSVRKAENHVNTMYYIIQCTLYIIQYTLLHYHTVYNVQYTLCSVHYTIYIIQCTRYKCTLYIYNIHYTIILSIENRDDNKLPTVHQPWQVQVAGVTTMTSLAQAVLREGRYEATLQEGTPGTTILLTRQILSS